MVWQSKGGKFSLAQFVQIHHVNIVASIIMKDPFQRQTQKDWVEFMQGHLPRSQNMEASEITKQASSEARLTITDLKMEVQKHPNIEEFYTFAIQSKDS